MLLRVGSIDEIACGENDLRGNIEDPNHKADGGVDKSLRRKEHSQHDGKVASKEKGDADSQKQRCCCALFAVIDPCVNEVQYQLGHGKASDKSVKSEKSRDSNCDDKEKIARYSCNQTALGGI